MTEQFPEIKHLFEARSVAVIGASAKPNKIGHKLIKNMVDDGYKGRIYPVNPTGGEVLGFPIYKSILDVEGEVDLALIVVPAHLVFAAVQECAEKKVKFLPIITSGFSEVGDKEEERKIVEYARAHSMRVLGPNIFGFFSAKASLNASFGPGGIKHGQVAIITQSGALGVAMIGKSAVENIGLSTIVSMGNKSDIDEADLLDYLVEQEETRVILIYIEGVQHGEKLVRALKATTPRKPVVVIKSGRSARGAIAAASHTGSLAGADEVFDDVMAQCGVLRAETIQDAFNWCKFLSDAPAPQGKNVAIVTNGGGVGVMATDAAEKFGVNLYDDQAVLRQVFGPVTPDFGSTKNPVDITGQAGEKEYNEALTAALEDPNIHSVIALYTETAVFTAKSLSQMILENYWKYQKKGKPISFSIIGGHNIQQSMTELSQHKVPVFEDVYDAVSVFGVLYRYHHNAQKAVETPPDYPIDVERISTVIAGARKEGRTFLLPHESSVVMEEAGIVMPRSGIASNLDQAVLLAKEIGFPVVMKVVSKDIIHKSDAGGVALDLDNVEEVMDAYQAIMHNCRRYDPAAKIKGVEISEMIEASIETIVGARQDPSFGPVVMFGLGGIYVEVMKDVAFRALPVTRTEAMDLIKEIRSYPLLLGVRGEKRKDIEGVVDTVLRMGCLIRSIKDISDIELNPLVVYDHGDGVKALDVRILLTHR